MSQTVAHALRQENSEETANFIEILDKFFDCLNATSIKSNVVMLHKLGAVPFGPKYEPITVAIYCILCVYMYHKSVLACRAYKVQFVVRCCNITMMSYKLHLSAVVKLPVS